MTNEKTFRRKEARGIKEAKAAAASDPPNNRA